MRKPEYFGVDTPSRPRPGPGEPPFRRALPDEAALLRPLARASEAHWGYDEAFLETFDRVFNITGDFIQENPVYVAREGGEPAAFWALTPGEEGWELEYFYVNARALGSGWGRRMWAHLTDWCLESGIGGFHFVTSPQATGFYLKMGAEPDGTRPSAIDGRPIPHFIYAIIGEENSDG